MPDPSPVTYRGVVYPRELDHMGHMNVVSYVAKFDEATWCFLSDLGFGGEFLRTSGRALAAVRYDISYKKELLAGDVVTIRTRLLRVGSSSFAYLHEMSNDETGELVATAEITGVLIDGTTRRSTPLPDDVAARLRELLG